MKGGDENLVGAFVVVGLLILLDIITGILKAGYEHDIQSTIMRKGLYHKIAEILAIVLGYLIEYGAAYINIPFNFPFVIAIISYISGMEIISVVENICKINPDLFKFFQKYTKFNESEEDKNES